ncbi:DUF7793 family protein [Flavobacterium daejeonense]|uniref:DUF7793 family protein n=1 Tax=Flavobacterium daejeonense TaxID=350893 RepID=UPI000690A540|nr:STAS/SEC14 domain-containing protein [Flavobacterium daejeonense]
MKENFIKNEYIEFWQEDGILFSRFQGGVEVDVERMKEAVKLREEISSGVNQYWLYDITRVKFITKEARDYADQYGQNYLHAVAVLVNSHITKFIFNTYIKLKKPIMPFFVFTNKKKALGWLLEVKEKGM